MFNHIFFLFIPDFDQSTSIFCLLDNFKCQPFLFGIFSRIRMAVRGGGHTYATWFQDLLELKVSILTIINKFTSRL